MQTCTVGFYGKYIPLQGVPYIVRAAAHPLCKDIAFTLIGSGQTYAQVRTLAQELGVANITFMERIPYATLIERMRSFDIVLGVFGDTPKARAVISNKLYDAAMLGKPLITADTPAVRELFTDGKDICLVPGADSEALAHAIHTLAQDSEKRTLLGRAIRATYEMYATPEAIGAELRRVLEARLVGGRAEVTGI